MVEEIKQEEKPVLIDDADKAAERLEKANSELKDLLKRQESLMARERLGGRTASGSVMAQPETQEEKVDKVVDEFFKGTGLDPLKPFRKKK